MIPWLLSMSLADLCKLCVRWAGAVETSVSLVLPSLTKSCTPLAPLEHPSAHPTTHAPLQNFLGLDGLQGSLKAMREPQKMFVGERISEGVWNRQLQPFPSVSAL